jgi:hypothetical protein
MPATDLYTVDVTRREILARRPVSGWLDVVRGLQYDTKCGLLLVTYESQNRGPDSGHVVMTLDYRPEAAP